MAVLCAECGGPTPCDKGHTLQVDISGQDMSWLQDDRLMLDPMVSSSLLNEMIGMESLATDLEADEIYWGYRPYPLGKLGKLLTKVAADIDRKIAPKFLEVGCGPGTKLVFIHYAFGWYVEGFDIDPSLASQASELLNFRDMDPGNAFTADAEDFDEYNKYDIVFLNRPMRDYDREVQLEQHVFANMRAGSYLLLANGLTIPHGWRFITQEVMCTVWQKVCFCFGVEDVLEYNRESEFDVAVLRCQYCMREITIA